MTEIPPPRYRVIERNRRLEVIDTRSGGVQTRRSAVPMQPRRPAVERISFDGAANLSTQGFYDDKGPRTIRLDPNRATIVRLAKIAAVVAISLLVAGTYVAPWLIALPAALLNQKSRKAVRRSITGWLDQAERESA